MSARRSTRRGTILVAGVILLAVLSLATLSAVEAVGDDARLNAMRADSLRAFYAAESAVQAAMHRRERDPGNPLTGTITLPDGSEAVVLDPLEGGTDGLLVIEGRAGEARRRLTIETE